MMPGRSQLTDLMSSSAATRAEGDGVKQQLRLKEKEMERCTLDLADEQVGGPLATAADRIAVC